MSRSIAFILLGLLPAVADAQLRVVTWNTLDRPTSSNDADFSTIFSAIATESINGIARPIDVIALQEQTANSPTNIAAILNGVHGVSSYVASTPSGQGDNDRLAFVYNTATVQLLQSSLVPSGGTRPFGRARFRPVGYTTAASEFYVYSLHLNASVPATREIETASLRANANTLGDVGIIFSGDYNIDDSNETAMLTLTNAGGSGRGFDPIDRPGTWTNNANFASIHTQSTRVTDLGDGGATGGVDDRFDIHLVSSPMLSGEGVSYLGPTAPGTVATHSYRAFGNNGSVFNRAINDTRNTSKPRAVLDALHRASDHLPVVMDLQLPARMNVNVAAAPTEVIQGAQVLLPVSVSNTAPVSTSLAGDELDYSIVGVGAVLGTGAGSIRPLVSAQVTQLILDTTTVGTRSGSVNVGSSSRAAQNASFSQPVSFRVLEPARPSFDPLIEVSTMLLNVRPLIDRPRDELQSVTLHNLADATLGAAMDIDRVLAEGDVDLLRLDLSSLKPLLPGESIELVPWLAPDAVGTLFTRYLIEVSDQDLPGERRHTMEIVLRATVPEPQVLLLLPVLLGALRHARRR
jgi:endonuclease/exonuclease/phosphatase family metal-dependent hydrolase